MSAQPDLIYQAQLPANDPWEPQVAPETGFSVHVDDRPVEGGTDPIFGEVTWRTLMCADQTPTREFVLGQAEFKAGERLLAHRHAPAEFYFGIMGSGEVTIEGKVHQIRPGLAIYVPGNAEHGVVAGPDGLKFVYGFAEARFGDVEYNFTAASA